MTAMFIPVSDPPNVECERRTKSSPQFQGEVFDSIGPRDLKPGKGNQVAVVGGSHRVAGDGDLISRVLYQLSYRPVVISKGIRERLRNESKMFIDELARIQRLISRRGKVDMAE